MAQFGILILPTPSTERVLLLRAQPEAEELVELENEGGTFRADPQGVRVWNRDDCRRGKEAEGAPAHGAGGDRQRILVYGEVGGKDQEVAQAASLVEVRDERTHEAGLANAGGKREAERGKIAIERGDGREGLTDDGERSGRVGMFR